MQTGTREGLGIGTRGYKMSTLQIDSFQLPLARVYIIAWFGPHFCGYATDNAWP